MAILIVLWVLCAFIGMAIGSSKGRAGTGFILGLVLGLIGIVIIAVMSPTPEVAAQQQLAVNSAVQRLGPAGGYTRPCPHCAEQIQPAAKVCRFCGRDVEPVPATLAPPAPGTPEGWQPDPSGRHPDRYWDGNAWTIWVRDKPGGTRSEDPPVPWSAAT
jgi:hypothetical protein